MTAYRWEARPAPGTPGEVASGVAEADDSRSVLASLVSDYPPGDWMVMVEEAPPEVPPAPPEIEPTDD